MRDGDREAQPLHARCVLIPRARSQAGPLVSLVEANGGEVFAFPVIGIADPADWAPLDAAIQAIERYRWLVITSPNGAEKFVGRAAVLGRTPADLSHLQVAAVGPTTARTLEQLGLKVAVIPAESRGAALPEAMHPFMQPGDRVLMARGNLANPALAEALRALGAVVDDLVAYQTVKADGDVGTLQHRLTDGTIHYVAFTSGSTVDGLISALGGPGWLSGVRVAAIGPETKKAAETAGLTVHCVARATTAEGLVEAIIEDCK